MADNYDLQSDFCKGYRKAIDDISEFIKDYVKENTTDERH